MSCGMDIASNACMKTSYKQGTLLLQIAVCDNEGKGVLTTSDLEKLQLLSSYL